MLKKTLKKAAASAKINLFNIKPAYIITGTVFAILLIQDIVDVILAMNGVDMSGQLSLSIGNAVYLLVPLAGIYMSRGNFRKYINLGGKRGDFFYGCFLSYALLSIAASAFNSIVYVSYDRWIRGLGFFEGTINLIEVFGWSRHGALFVLQQAAFLFLFALFAHTLFFMQDLWIGWLLDLLLASIIAVFTPIAPLRALEAGFFRLIIFQPSAWGQIAACVSLAVLIYAAGKPVLDRKSL